MSKPTCKKCGRVLTDPYSIAVGMGPKCRGDGPGRGGHVSVPVKRSGGKAYAAFGSGGSVGQPAPLVRDRGFTGGMEWDAFPAGFELALGEVPAGDLVFRRLSDGRWRNLINGRLYAHSYIRHHFSADLDAQRSSL